ncbi:MAG: gamma carbonic anhydrase family protein [Deltaproteobacteria bacterium]|nr:gamma carbonic anhydrase family protein [Deltaproteobacteria bacterium]
MPVYPYLDKVPRLHPTVWIAPTGIVAADVEIGEDCSIWFGAVVRGDVFPIRLGKRVNVQDNSVIHVTTDKYGTIVGDDVTIGHRAILHGCTVESGSLIGMGAIVMDDAVVGEGAFIGAGAVVTPGTRVPAHHLAVGSPARVKRPLTDEERAQLAWSPRHYVDVARAYAAVTGSGQGR